MTTTDNKTNTTGAASCHNLVHDDDVILSKLNLFLMHELASD